MIPYVSWTSFALGPITIHVWGVMVALGFVLAGFVAARFVKHHGDDPMIIWDLLLWVLAAGMIGGRLGHVFFYEPAYYWAHPQEIFAIWNGGMSLYGGVMLGAIIGIRFLRKRNVDVMRYADAVAFGLPFGLWIGRIGCFLIHDHPGTATHVFLGVQYPDGITRHDLGLYLSINGLLLGLLMLWISRKNRPTGMYIAVFSLWYGVARFCLDFFRIIDVRYFGLTPGQYFSVLLFGFGAGMMMWITKRSKSA